MITSIHKPEITEIILNIMNTIFTIIGLIIMVTNALNSGTFASSGLGSLKYFTVQSNLFSGTTSLVYLIMLILHTSERHTKGLLIAKLMSTTAIGLTFLMIAAFFGPLYGHSNLYKGSNLWFHLIIPIIAMIEFCIFTRNHADTLSDEAKNESGNNSKRIIPFHYTFFSAIPALLYGALYLTNLLINGVGEWSDTNDWYGFVNWGLPVGIGIFAGVVLMSWGVACLLRVIALKYSRSIKNSQE